MPRLTVEKGETLIAQGIVSQTKTGYRILPRDIDDIVLPKKKEGADGGQEKKEAGVPDKQVAVHGAWYQYAFTGLAALVVVVGGLFLEYFRKREKKDDVVVDKNRTS